MSSCEPCFLLAAILQAGTMGAGSNRPCMRVYAAQAWEFAVASHGPIYFTPPSQMDRQAKATAVAAFNARLGGQETVSVSDVGYTARWTSALFRVASDWFKSCVALGGRYWEVNLHTQNYIAALPRNASVPYLSFLHRIPPNFRSTICAPRCCSRLEVGSRVLPRLLMASFQNPLHDGAEQAPLPVVGLDLFELAHWDQLLLDFAVIGVDHCGTTSLQSNLAKHSEIGFPTDVEDEFLRGEVQHRLLPRLAQVNDFNDCWDKAGRQRPPLVGIRNAVHFSSSLHRMPLSLVPGLRVVLIVCDPVDRFEKLFWQHHQDVCRRPPSLAARTPCRHGIDKSVRMPELFVEGGNMRLRQHLREVVELFPDRNMLVHQEALQENPLLTYESLAKWLGTSVPFPAGTRFYRYNSFMGYRTGLCRNRTLVKELQQLLLADYSTLEELFSAPGRRLPRQLRLKLTRCDRPEELAEGLPSCGPDVRSYAPRCEPNIDIPNCTWCAN
mmetsp:Transcript_106832/g.297405  ORF Transcript_106832/g.297405 Transcript_106832/m.297405 type:complete len:497 (-) Transcript_106832:48-1538(-)